MEKKLEKEKNIIIIMKLKFEGEYYNGKRDGEGKEFNLIIK